MATRSGNSALTRWLERRVGDWQRLAELVRSPRDTRGVSAQASLELARRFRSLSRDRAMAATLVPGTRLARDLDALYLRTHEVIHRPPRRLWHDLVIVLRDEVPAIVRDMRGSIAVVSALFLGCALAGWMLVTAFPELAALFASPGMRASVESGELWTDDLLNVVPSSVLSISLMANNIAVSITAFTLGALFGLGAIYVIALNGLMLGGVFAYTHQFGLADRLFSFVVAHGVVELSVICLAGAAGLELGKALIEPGDRSRARAFQDQAGRAGKLLLAVALFLVGAGLIEGYISPDDRFGLGVRITVGLTYGALLVAVLAGWTGRRSDPTPAA